MLLLYRLLSPDDAVYQLIEQSNGRKFLDLFNVNEIILRPINSIKAFFILMAFTCQVIASPLFYCDMDNKMAAGSVLTQQDRPLDQQSHATPHLVKPELAKSAKAKTHCGKQLETAASSEQPKNCCDDANHCAMSGGISLFTLAQLTIAVHPVTTNKLIQPEMLIHNPAPVSLYRPPILA